LHLSKGKDLKFEAVINEKIQDPVYFPHISKIFAEIVTVFEKFGKSELLRPAFCKIFFADFKDSYLDILKDLPKIVNSLFSQNDFDTETEEIKKKLEEDLKFKNEIMNRIKDLWNVHEKGAWRSFVTLIDIIPDLQHLFPLVEYNHYFIDKLWTIYQKSNNEIKQISLKSICKFLLSPHYSSKRKEHLTKIIDLAISPSFYDRRQFLYLSDFIVETFACSILKEIGFYKKFIRLGTDKVPNIKLGFCKHAQKIWTFSIFDEENKDCGNIRSEILTILNMLKVDQNSEVRNISEKVHTFILENREKIIKGDSTRLARDSQKEELEKELRSKEEEEMEEKKERELQKIREQNAKAISLKKSIKTIAVKPPKEQISKIPQKYQTHLKKSKDAVVLSPQIVSGITKKKPQTKSIKNSLIKNHGTIDVNNATDINDGISLGIKVKGTSMKTHKYQLSSKLLKK